MGSFEGMAKHWIIVSTTVGNAESKYVNISLLDIRDLNLLATALVASCVAHLFEDLLCSDWMTMVNVWTIDQS